MRSYPHFGSSSKAVTTRKRTSSGRRRILPARRQTTASAGCVFSRAAKRLFGFIYLRALRTGTRALSLERGSLLDVILKLKDEERSAMWEKTLQAMEDLDPAVDEIPQLRVILNEIDARVRRFVGLSDEERTLRLVLHRVDAGRHCVELSRCSARRSGRTRRCPIGA